MPNTVPCGRWLRALVLARAAHWNLSALQQTDQQLRAQVLITLECLQQLWSFTIPEYELRSISRDSFDTTRSIWTFVTNQRRILDDNAPKNSRSEAQLVVVKIPPWLFAVLVQKGHHKVKNVSFFTNAFETLGTRWRAGRLEVTGSDTRTSCGMYSYKRQTRTLASSGRTVRRIPGSHPPHRLSERRRAAD